MTWSPVARSAGRTTFFVNFVSNCLVVEVLRKAVAEVSKKGHNRRGETL